MQGSIHSINVREAIAFGRDPTVIEAHRLHIAQTACRLRASERDTEAHMGRIADMRGRHPLATGILAGTAIGACVGILLAPRRGSETRKRVGDGVNSGYRRAKGTVGQWAKSGQGAYKSTRDQVVKGAKGTTQYVREVAGAVTRKAHREGDAALRRMSSASSSGAMGQQPRKAI